MTTWFPLRPGRTIRSAGSTRADQIMGKTNSEEYQHDWHSSYRV
jgi:hypothetical protein